MIQFLFRVALLILTAWAVSAQSLPAPGDSTPGTAGANSGSGNQGSAGKGNSPSTQPSSAEQDWDDLQEEFHPGRSADNRPSNSEKPIGGLRQNTARDYLNAADKAKAFRSKHPAATALVAQARRLEAQALFGAVMAGEESLEQRAFSLLSEVRGDSLVGDQERFDLVAMAELAESRKNWGNSDQRLENQEKSARRLISEFPRLAGGYVALLNCIQNNPDPDAAATLAIELQSMPAPQAVKEASQVFVGRRDLVGRSIVDLLREGLGSDNVVEKALGEIIVIYVWASWSPGSVARAKEVMRLAPEKVALFSVSLDQDQDRARLFAENERLPGEILGGGGAGQKIAEVLQVGNDFPIYLIDQNGEITSVSESIRTISEAVRGQKR